MVHCVLVQSDVVWVGELAQTQVAIVPTILVEGLRNITKKGPSLRYPPRSSGSDRQSRLIKCKTLALFKQLSIWSVLIGC
jgi:hypothetical protein